VNVGVSSRAAAAAAAPVDKLPAHSLGAARVALVLFARLILYFPLHATLVIYLLM